MEVEVALPAELPKGARPDLTVEGTIELEKLKHVQAAFLQKPFSPHTLLLKVREILDAPATATTTEESLSDGSESPVNRH